MTVFFYWIWERTKLDILQGVKLTGGRMNIDVPICIIIDGKKENVLNVMLCDREKYT